MTARMETALRALDDIRKAHEAQQGQPGPHHYPALAQDVAYAAGVRGVRRHGNGAVKGSWSGFTSPALAIATTMTALVKAGYVHAGYDPRSERTRHTYGLTPKGRDYVRDMERAGRA